MTRLLPAIAVLLASIGVAAGMSGCNPFSQEVTPTDAPVVKVGVVPSVDNATLYLATKHGYFSRAGIGVQYSGS